MSALTPCMYTVRRNTLQAHSQKEMVTHSQNHAHIIKHEIIVLRYLVVVLLVLLL